MSEEPVSSPQPYREPLWKTLRRTLAIAFFITTALTLILPSERPFVVYWLAAYAAVLWMPLGGHYVELAYLSFLRIRWGWVHRHRVVTRLAWWFVGGLPLGIGCWWTWVGLGNEAPFELPFWWGMPFFVVVECIVHAVLQVLGLPSFWNGRE